jgi:uncharacterized protein (TIRG00374 family)
MIKFFSYSVIKKTINFILGVSCVLYAYSLFKFTPHSIIETLIKFNFLEIVTAAGLYLLSHTARTLRLLLLSPVMKINIRNLWKAQYKTNGVNLLLPFKLGEIYRLIFFKKLFGSYSNSFAVLIVERFLDLVTIFLALCLALYFFNTNIQVINYILFISIFLLSIIITTLFVFDEILIILHRILLNKPSTKMVLTAIEFSGKLIKAIKKIKSTVNKKYIPCLLVSFIIWSLEISAFFIFLELLEFKFDLLIFLAISVFFASLLPNAPLGYGGTQIAFHYIGQVFQLPQLVSYSFVYNIYIFGAGLLLAGFLFLLDLRKQ